MYLELDLEKKANTYSLAYVVRMFCRDQNKASDLSLL